MSEEKKDEGAKPEATKPEPKLEGAALEAANAKEAMHRMGEERDKARKALEAMQAKVAKEAEERKLAEMGEVERAKAEAAKAAQEVVALRDQMKAATISAEVKLVGLREGANDVADLLAFVSRESMEIGEDGTVKGVEEAIKSLKERKPYLFKAASDQKKPAGEHPPNSTTPVKGSASTPDPAAYRAETIRRNAAARGIQVS